MPSDLRPLVTRKHKLPDNLTPNGIFQGFNDMPGEPISWNRLGTMDNSTIAHNVAWDLARNTRHENAKVPPNHRGYNPSIWGYTDHRGQFFIISADHLTVQIRHHKEARP